MSKAKTEMTRKVAFVAENDTIDKAYNSMKALEIRHVPVLRDGKLVGILSDRDILLEARPDHSGISVPQKPVFEVMTRELITCTPDTTISHCADLMIENKIDSLPVVDADFHLKGILTSTDLLRLLRDRDPVDRDRIPFSWQAVPLFHLPPCWRPEASAMSI